ncbi:hypothetical protein CXG81DRAFT_19878 [Caulochytrium protostelioides]|uniref:Uncharacterized protein n=1 Tax=Caulochytrium protostelioides TaxID=1555241 RepID=A0A4P9X4Y0_9FUNG|nr:hypothetical protein CXG81DRAFT_19878 [Caulochytrium protostelioides]|eukprot:RKP00111.1 hypothetical protein CXG81DRAFT_19878 [Caulochytrium protostelioides]
MRMVIRGSNGFLPMLLLAFLMCLVVTAMPPPRQDASKETIESRSQQRLGMAAQVYCSTTITSKGKTISKQSGKAIFYQILDALFAPYDEELFRLETSYPKIPMIVKFFNSMNVILDDPESPFPGKIHDMGATKFFKDYSALALNLYREWLQIEDLRSRYLDRILDLEVLWFYLNAYLSWYGIDPADASSADTQAKVKTLQETEENIRATLMAAHGMTLEANQSDEGHDEGHDEEKKQREVTASMAKAAGAALRNALLSDPKYQKEAAFSNYSWRVKFDVRTLAELAGYLESFVQHHRPVEIDDQHLSNFEEAMAALKNEIAIVVPSYRQVKNHLPNLDVGVRAAALDPDFFSIGPLKDITIGSTTQHDPVDDRGQGPVAKASPSHAFSPTVNHSDKSVEDLGEEFPRNDGSVVIDDVTLGGPADGDGLRATDNAAGNLNRLADDHHIGSDEMKLNHGAFGNEVTPTPGGPSQSQLSHGMDTSPSGPDFLSDMWSQNGNTGWYGNDARENYLQQWAAPTGDILPDAAFADNNAASPPLLSSPHPNTLSHALSPARSIENGDASDDTAGNNVYDMLAGEHNPLANDPGIGSDDLFDYDAYVERLTPTPGGPSPAQLSHGMEISPGDTDIFPDQFLTGGHSEDESMHNYMLQMAAYGVTVSPPELIEHNVGGGASPALHPSPHLNAPSRLPSPTPPTSRTLAESFGKFRPK